MFPRPRCTYTHEPFFVRVHVKTSLHARTSRTRACTQPAFGSLLLHFWTGGKRTPNRSTFPGSHTRAHFAHFTRSRVPTARRYYPSDCFVCDRCLYTPATDPPNHLGRCYKTITLEAHDGRQTGDPTHTGSDSRKWHETHLLHSFRKNTRVSTTVDQYF